MDWTTIECQSCADVQGVKYRPSSNWEYRAAKAPAQGAPDAHRRRG